jgi:copper chaperone
MLRFHIPNMSCGGCAKSVTKVLQSVDPKTRIEINARDREARVDSVAPESEFLAALERAGYPANLHSEVGKKRVREQ